MQKLMRDAKTYALPQRTRSPGRESIARTSKTRHYECLCESRRQILEQPREPRLILLDRLLARRLLRLRRQRTPVMVEAIVRHRDVVRRRILRTELRYRKSANRRVHRLIEKIAVLWIRNREHAPRGVRGRS